jgi:hypothetical protein
VCIDSIVGPDADGEAEPLLVGRWQADIANIKPNTNGNVVFAVAS